MDVQYKKFGERVHLVHMPAQADKHFSKQFVLLTCGGSDFEKPEQSGISHFLEHSLMSGTPKISTIALNKYLYLKTMGRNASTSDMYLRFLLYGHQSDRKRMLQLLMELTFDNTIIKSIVERERKIVLSEIGTYGTSPQAKLREYVAQEILEPNSPGLLRTLGYDETVSPITIENLQERWDQVKRDSHIIFLSIGTHPKDSFLDEKLDALSHIYNSPAPHAVDFNKQKVFKPYDYKPIVHEYAKESVDLEIKVPLKITLENAPIRSFISRMLLGGGQFSYLKNVLRNKLGVIYGNDIGFSKSEQYMKLTINTRAKHLQKIMSVLYDAVESVKIAEMESKFEKMKQAIVKGEEITLDNKYTDDPEWVVDYLVTHGKFYTREDYIEDIKKTTFAQVLEFNTSIAKALPKMKIIAISKDPTIEKLKLLR